MILTAYFDYSVLQNQKSSFASWSVRWASIFFPSLMDGFHFDGAHIPWPSTKKLWHGWCLKQKIQHPPCQPVFIGFTCFVLIVSVGREEDKEKGKGGTLRPKLPIQSSLSGNNVGSQINFSPADPKYDSQSVPWEHRTEIEIQPLLPESSKRLSYLQSSFIKRQGKKSLIFKW